MTRFKRTPEIHRRTPARITSRIYAHTPPTHSTPQRRRRAYVQGRAREWRDDEDTIGNEYSWLLPDRDSDDDDDAVDDDAASTSDDDDDFDEEATLQEILGSNRTHDTEDIGDILGSVLTDATRNMREEIAHGVRPVVERVRSARFAPGRPFVDGLLGFDDVCKDFESRAHRVSAELSPAHQKIQAEMDELYERLQVVCRRVEERRATFEKRVKEHVDAMREIVDALPADVEVLATKLEKKFKDSPKDGGGISKSKARERTFQGALAELQL
ncbi:hypothetical protein BC834DRAFT_887480 [Gloeopeniophorella convolvens]|nr:hypothetical protein BC834DRAFT_887480 [Gloeopeniophorella convolvens]